MPRWTESIEDIKRISRISTELPVAGIVSIKLTNNQTVEGVIRGSRSGNNAGQNGWKYYGDVEIETLNKERMVIDYLDIETAKSIWDTHHQEYEKNGLIRILN